MRDDKCKRVYSESSKSVQQNQCFKCQEFGHITAQCPSKTKTLIIETQLDSYQDHLEEVAYDPEGDVWEDELVVNQTIDYSQMLHHTFIFNLQ